MNFELLPNETILDIFEYISIVDLFHGFSNLNLRFKQLILVQFRKFHLDLRFLSKTKFHYICKNFLPRIVDRIISLRLSNDDNTPQMIQLFLSQQFQLRQFTHLQSVKLSFLRSCETLNQIMIECSYLSSLKHLSFTYGYIPMDDNDADRFFNHIWNFKNLIYYHLDISFGFQNYFPNPTVVSTSLKYLSVQKNRCSLPTLVHLFQQTPNLEYLSINYEDHSDQSIFISPIQSIIRLKLNFSGSIDALEYLLRNLPNLRHLTFETKNIYINGHQWKELICKYLPKLKILQFNMNFSPLNDKDKENQINEIIDTYRTKFWITERQWYVQCQGHVRCQEQHFAHINLFTLPYIFENFIANTTCILTKSTNPSNDYEYLKFNNVKYLHCGSSVFMNSIASCFRFYNIEDLILTFNCNDQFLSVIPKLNRLISLHIFIEKDMNVGNIQLQLQFLLDRALHLRLLRLNNCLQVRSPISLMEIMNVSVRQLNFLEYIYEEEECIHLSRSPLDKQCETLWIVVGKRKNILALVNNMPNLQALIIQCADDSRTKENDSIQLEKDELVKCLCQQFSSTCMIRRDPYWVDNIELWIR